MASMPREEAPATGTNVSIGSVRRVLASSAVGQFVENYDFVIYAYSAAIIAKLFFPTEDPVAGILSVFAVYAVGFGIRPIGAVVWGLIGDRVGRKSTLVVIIIMMGSATMAIGLLPTYSQVGILAPILLVVCRAVQGFSQAGETMTSNTFVGEYAPRSKRGLYVAIGYSFTTVPSVVAALFVYALLNLMGQGVYESWGWRIAFLVGGPIALIGFYIRSKIKESPVFEAAQATQEIAEAKQITQTKTSSKRAFALTLSLAAVGAVGFYTLSGYMVSFLTTTAHLPQQEALLSNGIAIGIAVVFFWIGGALSDRFGRKPILFSALAAIIVVFVPAFAIAGNGTFAGALIGQTMMGMILGYYYGVNGVVILEAFSTRNRVSGSVIGFNISYAIFGGTAPLLATWLIVQTGLSIAPAIYAAILTTVALIVVLALKIPETRGTSMLHADDRLEADGALETSGR